MDDTARLGDDGRGPAASPDSIAPAAAPNGPPLIGRPSPPPPALVVAIAGQLSDLVCGARRSQFLVNLAGIVVGTALAAAVALVLNKCFALGRLVAFVEATLLGVLLVLGVLMRRRPLQLGTGIIARSERGGLAVGASLRGIALLVPGAFREAAEGLIYVLGLIRTDPSAELAAWLLLALAPPHGPAPGTWVSLGGLSAAGFFSLPEDLTTALRGLGARKWVEADTSVYPPRVRLTPDGVAYIDGVFGKRK